MSALIPIKNDPEKNAIAMHGIINDKKRDATDGYDGGWVRSPRPGRAGHEGIRGSAGRHAQPVRQATRDDVNVTRQGPAGLPAGNADHRSRPAHEHQRRHPLPRLLAGRQRLRAHP
ncbi:hypothetical protein ACU4GD_39515 [Cupriavidus basilensis]